MPWEKQNVRDRRLDPEIPLGNYFVVTHGRGWGPDRRVLSMDYVSYEEALTDAHSIGAMVTNLSWVERRGLELPQEYHEIVAERELVVRRAEEERERKALEKEERSREAKRVREREAYRRKKELMKEVRGNEP